MDKKATIRESLKIIFHGIKQLREAFPKKSFTIDGRLVGDIGEIIAALEYGIELYEVQKANHDGETSDDRKVQVKATFKDSLTYKTVPDYYLGFKLFEDGQYEEIFNGPGNIIYEHYKHRKGIGEKQLSFPVKKLKKLSGMVPESERIQLCED
jgi:hypothetical protein